MRRAATLFVSLAGAAFLAFCAAILVAPSPAPGHGTFHLNCPPGSHGKPRHVNFARSLGHEPGAARVQVRERAITSGRF